MNIYYDYFAFAGACLAVAGLLILYVQKVQKKEVKRAAMGGIKGFILFGLVFASLGLMNRCSPVIAAESPQLEFFAFGEVYLGLDVTNHSPSPFCEPEDISGNGPNDRLTSNGGLRFNFLRYGNFDMNAKYTHHSGATCDDDQYYDAAGVEFTYAIWGAR